MGSISLLGSVWSGDVYLSNVELQCNAWNELFFGGKNNDNGKYRVKIGSIALNVPWVKFCKGVKGIVRLDLNDIEIVIGYDNECYKSNVNHDQSSVRLEEEMKNKEENSSNSSNSGSSSSTSMLNRIMQYIASSFVWWVLVGLHIEIKNVKIIFEQEQQRQKKGYNNGKYTKIGIDIPNISINDSDIKE